MRIAVAHKPYTAAGLLSSCRFEQKAVAVLLTLLSLGVKNVRLGPRLPAFLTPEAVQQLVQTFAIKPADTENAAADLKLMMSNN